MDDSKEDNRKDGIGSRWWRGLVRLGRFEILGQSDCGYAILQIGADCELLYAAGSEV